MTITLASWCIPLLITICIWIAVTVAMWWPRTGNHYGFDVTGGLLAILYLFLGVVASLVTWLVYFIVV